MTLNASLQQSVLNFQLTEDITLKQLNSQVMAESPNKISIHCDFPVSYFSAQAMQQLQKQLSDIAKQAVNIDLKQAIVPHEVQAPLKPLANVKNIIAVASGKGGVGKSTVSTNLAYSLLAAGAKVGILDADIYGPNQPQMLGVPNEKPQSPDGQKLEPVMSHGLQTMSIGYLIDTAQAMIWRGPMVTTALKQLLNDCLWHDLDYLILDLPPGTGDIQLTMAQKIPIAGSVLVTTPQSIAVADVRRAVTMFNKVNLPILGVVENMSFYHCAHCGHDDNLFGQGGGRKMAAEFNLNLLGQIPLHPRICELSDQGVPLAALASEHDIASYYQDLARNVAWQLAARKRSYADRFPNIVVEK